MQNPFEAPLTQKLDERAESKGFTGMLDVGRCMTEGWNATWANFPLWLGVVIVSAIITNVGIYTILGIFLIAPVMLWGEVFFYLKAFDGDASFNDLFAGFSRYGSALVSMLGFGFLMLGLFCAGFVSWGVGLVLGSEPLSGIGALVAVGWMGAVLIRFALAPFFIVDQDMGAVDAMKASWGATREQKLSMLGLAFLSGIVGIAGILVFVVGVVASSMVFRMMYVSAYRQLTGTYRAASRLHLALLAGMTAFALGGATACSSDAGHSDGGQAIADTGSGVDAAVDGGGSGSDAAEDAGTADGGLDPGVAPVRRGDMAYAVDPLAERAYMFFGDRAEPMMCGFVASDFIDDGWSYDFRTRRWASITVQPGSLPIRRARAQGVWDAQGGRFLLFGGRFRQGTAGAYAYMNDLWAFDPSTGVWEELSRQGNPQAPSGRMNATMVADAARNRVLVHGGGTTDLQTFQVDSQTWAFDLGTNAWSRIGLASPPVPRIFHVAAFDAMRRRMFVFGGCGRDCFTATSFFRDLWYLDVETGGWTQVRDSSASPTFPLGRIKSAMEYDEARDRLILFAGHDDGQLGNDNDVWTFDLAAGSWTRQIQGDTFNRLFPGQPFCDFPADFANIDPESPERRESHLFLVHGDTALMYGGRTDCGLTNDTWSLDLAGMRWMQITISFNGMTCFRSGRTDCNDPDARKCG